MANLRKKISLLKQLQKVRGKKRCVLLRHNNELTNTLSDACANLLNGKIVINDQKLTKLKRYRRAIRAAANRKNSLRKRRNNLLGQKGGFLSILIPAALSLLTSLLGK